MRVAGVSLGRVSTVMLRPALAGDAAVVAEIWHRGWPDDGSVHVPAHRYVKRV